MRFEPTIDVGHLPNSAFGTRAPIWWGTTMLLAIEGTMFGMLLVTYLYLMREQPAWPPGDTPPPDLTASILMLALLGASLVPNLWLRRLAENHAPKGPIRFAMGSLIVVCAAIVVARVFEFRSLHCWWSDHAYGSIVWTILGMHTGHVVSSTLENVILLVLVETQELDEHRRVDLTVNSLYWNFVVGSWVPMWALVYVVPRLT
jgi:heme/copper-type cytochrome/quinol oxidase subunit 3